MKKQTDEFPEVKKVTITGKTVTPPKTSDTPVVVPVKLTFWGKVMKFFGF